MLNFAKNSLSLLALHSSVVYYTEAGEMALLFSTTFLISFYFLAGSNTVDLPSTQKYWNYSSYIEK